MSLTIMKQVFAVALYALGGVSINTNKDLYQPARHHRLLGEHKVHDRIGPGLPGVAEVTAPEIRLRTYLYRFEGRALFKGQPMAGAKVILQVMTSRTSEVREAVTADDGSYSIALTVEGSRNEPVDWEMKAYTPDMKKVELVGRRIAMQEDDSVTVHKNLDLNDPAA